MSSRLDTSRTADAGLPGGGPAGPSRCPACAMPMPATAALVGVDRLHGTPGEFSVAICSRCGSGLTLPLVADADLAAFYPDAYNAYALPANALLRMLATLLFRWRYWRGLRRTPLGALSARPPGRLLDVGGGRGDLGVVLGRRGWTVTSLDPSAQACEEARERGVRGVVGTLSAPPEDLGWGYDAIVFQHSLEHVNDPARELANARERLAPEGLLLVTAPNFGCWQRRVFGSAWFHLDLPRHRSHLTPAGLRALLEREGFAVRALATSTSADGLPMSLEYRLLGRGIGIAVGRYLAAAVGIVASPLTALTSLVGGGGDILHAVASRAPSGDPGA